MQINAMVHKSENGPNLVVQHLVVQFLELRRQVAKAISQERFCEVLPVLLLASTRATLASFRGAISGYTKVGDLTLPRLSPMHMKNIVSDLLSRHQVS